MAGAFGGATLAKAIDQALQSIPALAPYGEGIGIAVVVAAITYCSLIIGELVPKRLAMNNPEGIACWMAKPMLRLSALAHPIIQLLGYSTDLVLRVFGIKAKAETPVSDEEITMMLQEGVKAGIFHKAEPKMVESVLSLDHLPVREIMTPRAKMMFLKKDDLHNDIWHKVVVSGHSNFPVYDGNRDNVIGIVSVKAIYAHLAANIPVRLADLVMPPLVVPAIQPVLRLLDTFKQSRRQVALVADEFGSIVGLVTLVDVLEAITGEIPSQEERLQPQAKIRPDGTCLVDGLLEVEHLREVLPGLEFPRSEDRNYETLAGFIIDQLGHVPVEGESVEWLKHHFEVIDMDHHRVDKILIAPPKPIRP